MNFIISIGRNVSIVRNVRPMPMDIQRWQNFQTEILTLAKECGTAVYFKGVGTGVYDGIEEESFTVIGEMRGVGPILAMNVDFMRQDLADIAARFSQEAIALTFAEPEFIKATAP